MNFTDKTATTEQNDEQTHFQNNIHIYVSLILGLAVFICFCL